MEHLAQILLLLVVSVSVIATFQRLHIPTALGYLLVGAMLGPFTIGPAVYVPEFQALAEFGVVFLLFTVGLNFSLPQLQALRHHVLWLGTGQVVFTTIVAGIIVWLAGLPATAAFVFGAVFAQSSTSIIGSQLSEQNEENSHHGRLGLAMSVFQDVTAVPFLVLIPVLGVAVSADVLAGALGWAFAKAVIAFALVFFIGRWVLRPLFHIIAERRSAELFTLSVLMVALWAAWTTNSLGLSLAFGGFLAGMMLGETEFRHQVESSIRPFRDVLLGLFFVGIGMRINPAALLPIWHWVLLGALLILVSKTVIVALLLRIKGTDKGVAWRTGLLLAVGGEFGLALVAIALDNHVLDDQLGQVAMNAVLLAMVAGALLIRFNGTIVSHLVATPAPEQLANMPVSDYPSETFVVVGGYGRVGRTIALLLHSNNIPFIAFDTDPARIRLGRSDGHPVSYGSIADPDLLSTLHIERAAMLIITIDQTSSALKAINYLRMNCPQVPIVARARDLETSTRFLDAGATHAHPETIEASIRLGEAAMKMLHIPEQDIEETISSIRDWGYMPILKDTPDNEDKPEH